MELISYSSVRIGQTQGYCIELLPCRIGRIPASLGGMNTNWAQRRIDPRSRVKNSVEPCEPQFKYQRPPEYAAVVVTV